MALRIRWRAVVIVLVLMGAAVGVILGMGLLDREVSLRPEVDELLSRLAPGGDEAAARKEAIELYEGASYFLREAVLRDRFLDMADRLNRTLGAFQSVVEITEVERNSSIAGETARVVLELEFAEGRTEGEVSFLREEGGPWRLLGVYVVIPEALRDEAEALEAQYERIKAPPEVLERIEAILERIRDGAGAGVYADASDQFKESVELESFQTLLSSQREALGSFVRVLAVISSGQNGDRTRARVYALLEYEEQKTTGTFEFIKAPGDAARGQSWVLAYYRIIIPQPLLPTRE